jgi:hypothetical protein
MSHNFAKKLAIARYTKVAEKKDPFKKSEFPTLKSLAINTVANNFELYPQLEDIPPMI